MSKVKTTIHHGTPVSVGLVPLSVNENKVAGLGVKLQQIRVGKISSFGFVISDELLHSVGYSRNIVPQEIVEEAKK